MEKCSVCGRMFPLNQLSDTRDADKGLSLGLMCGDCTRSYMRATGRKYGITIQAGAHARASTSRAYSYPRDFVGRARVAEAGIPGAAYAPTGWRHRLGARLCGRRHSHDRRSRHSGHSRWHSCSAAICAGARIWFGTLHRRPAVPTLWPRKRSLQRIPVPFAANGVVSDSCEYCHLCFRARDPQD
jgi:hypothetical protein